MANADYYFLLYRHVNCTLPAANGSLPWYSWWLVLTPSQYTTSCRSVLIPQWVSLLISPCIKFPAWKCDHSVFAGEVFCCFWWVEACSTPKNGFGGPSFLARWNGLRVRLCPGFRPAVLWNSWWIFNGDLFFGLNKWWGRLCLSILCALYVKMSSPTCCNDGILRFLIGVEWLLRFPFPGRNAGDL